MADTVYTLIAEQSIKKNTKETKSNELIVDILGKNCNKKQKAIENELQLRRQQNKIEYEKLKQDKAKFKEFKENLKQEERLEKLDNELMEKEMKMLSKWFHSLCDDLINNPEKWSDVYDAIIKRAENGESLYYSMIQYRNDDSIENNSAKLFPLPANFSYQRVIEIFDKKVDWTNRKVFFNYKVRNRKNILHNLEIDCHLPGLKIFSKGVVEAPYITVDIYKSEDACTIL